MKIQNVGIIGQGFVGKALNKSFSPHYNVYTYDKAHPNLSTHKNVGKCLGFAKLFLFVFLPQ